MTRRRTSLAPLAVLLVFCGVWISHTLEYLRVEGTYAIRDELTGSVHAYMLPTAAVLAILSTLAGARIWGAWVSVGARLDQAGRALGDILHNRQVSWAPQSALRVPSLGSSLALIWPQLALAQLVIYVIQENLEASAVDAPLPGLAVISGANAPALWIHLGVALLLATVVALIGGRLHDRVDALARSESLITRLLWQRRGIAPLLPRRHASWVPSPLERLGAVIWTRPPPARACP